MKSICAVLVVCFLSNHVVNCGVYSLYKRHKSALNDVSVNDKVQIGNIVGDIRKIDKNDVHVSQLLGEHLGRLITGDNSKFVVDRIDEISRQTVAGMSYRIKGHYFVEGDAKQCTVTILERPWHETEKINISAKCDDGSCYVTEAFICSPKSLKGLF